MEKNAKKNLRDIFLMNILKILNFPMGIKKVNLNK